MGEKKVVNLSRFLMFEEAGDSEADFDGNMALDYDQVNADDDDDAESCSSDVGCYGPLQSRGAQIEISEGSEEQVYNETHSDENDEDDVDYDENGCHHHDHKMRAFEEDEFEEEEAEDEIISEVTSTANSYNSRKCVQSSNNNLSEMEKSRLFWEACLAS